MSGWLYDIEEKWLPLSGEFAGRPYEVSDRGRVRQQTGEPLKPSLINSGYLRVGLRHGKHRGATINKLVAEAFLGPRPPGADVNHKDGVKTNNHIANLEYVTRKQNMRHAQDSGIWDNKGQKNGRAKATDVQVITGYKLVKSGIQIKDAALAVGMSPTQLQNATSGRKWKHLGLQPLRLRRAPRISDKSRALILSLRQGGHTLKQIASIAKIGMGSVHRICKDALEPQTKSA